MAHSTPYGTVEAAGICACLSTGLTEGDHDIVNPMDIPKPPCPVIRPPRVTVRCDSFSSMRRDMCRTWEDVIWGAHSYYEYSLVGWSFDAELLACPGPDPIAARSLDARGRVDRHYVRWVLGVAGSLGSRQLLSESMREGIQIDDPHTRNEYFRFGWRAMTTSPAVHDA